MREKTEYAIVVSLVILRYRKVKLAHFAYLRWWLQISRIDQKMRNRWNFIEKLIYLNFLAPRIMPKTWRIPLKITIFSHCLTRIRRLLSKSRPSMLIFHSCRSQHNDIAYGCDVTQLSVEQRSALFLPEMQMQLLRLPSGLWSAIGSDLRHIWK